MSLDIYAADEQADHPVAVERWAALARSVLEAEGITSDTEVSLLFIDETSIAALNLRFLDKEGPTDVLSFPIEDEIDRSGRSPDEGGTGPASIEAATGRHLLLGDVVICPSVAAVNAVDHGVTFDDEIALLVVHGILHLLGMDHMVDEEAERMERREQQLLDRFYRAAPLLETPGLMTATVAPEDVVLPVVVVVLLLASAVLALSETALVRMSRAKAKSLADEGRRGAKVLVRLTEDPQGFLNPVLLLVLICQLVVATLVGILAVRWFGAWGVAVATFFEIVVIFVFAEAVPKNWAVHHPERAALFSAPLVSAVVRFWPVRMVSGGLIGLANLFIGQKGGYVGALVTESELLAMADVAVEGDVIETEERALIHSIIEFGDTVVREVMVPRTDMVTIGADGTVESALDVALEAGFSRMPAVEQQIDDVVGIAYTKDMIRKIRAGQGDDPVASHLRPERFVPETKRVADLIREMQSDKFHLAVVVNEYGGTAGLVTLEDLIEELVGEIVDEFDVEEVAVETLATGGLRVSARLPVDEVNDLLDAQLPTGAWDTVGGLVFDLLGHVPVAGESVTSEGMRLIVDRVNGRRIERVSIVPMADAAPAEERVTVFRSGFVAVVGRPNVGKSTLVNAMVGTKVSIVSPRPNTTRSQVRGVLNRADAQVVFVDTPGLHKPKTALGERMNESATSSLDDVDAVVALVEATGAVGPGDRMVLGHSVQRVRAMARAAGLTVELGGGDPERIGRPTLMVVVNKIDRVGGDGVLGHLTGVSAVVEALDAEQGGDPVPVEYFPLSATTGDGVPPLVDALVACMPEGPRYYPEGMITDVAEAFWVADLVREELLHRVADELPHSIACRVTEWEWPRVRCEILVERDSQKGIVIGKGGATLKEVGTAVRAQMDPGAYLELFVRVEKRWQQREESLDRLGF